MSAFFLTSSLLFFVACPGGPGGPVETVSKPIIGYVVDASHMPAANRDFQFCYEIIHALPIPGTSQLRETNWTPITTDEYGVFTSQVSYKTYTPDSSYGAAAGVPGSAQRPQGFAMTLRTEFSTFVGTMRAETAAYYSQADLFFSGTYPTPEFDFVVQ